MTESFNESRALEGGRGPENSHLSQTVDRSVAGVRDKDAGARQSAELVDQGVLPVLGLVGTHVSDSDRSVLNRFPELNDTRRFVQALKDALPLADADGDGMSRSELDKFVEGPGKDTPEGGAAKIALNHFNPFYAQGSPERFFFRIDGKDIGKIESDLHLVDMADNKQLRNPEVFADTLLNAHDRITGDSNGVFHPLALRRFAEGQKGPSTELERAAAAKALVHYNALAPLTRGFGAEFLEKSDLEAVKVLGHPRLQEAMAKAFDEATANPANPALRGAGWAVAGYFIGKALGVEHPGRTAALTGLAGSATASRADSRPASLMKETVEKRQYLESTNLFDLPAFKK